MTGFVREHFFASLVLLVIIFAVYCCIVRTNGETSNSTQDDVFDGIELYLSLAHVNIHLEVERYDAVLRCGVGAIWLGQRATTGSFCFAT